MENFKITKEQIITLHKIGNSTVKKNLELTFPDAIKKELEVGKWYVVTNIAHGSLGFTGIGQYTLDSSTAGLLNSQSGYNFKQANGTIWRTNGYINKATEKEVKTALIKEANKKGLTNGAYIKSTDMVFGLINHGHWIYHNSEDKLFYGGFILFDNGKWAEIIETTTKEEAEKLLNKKII